MAVKRRKAEQADETRTALLAAARSLFTERGYADTPLDLIATRANVTKGALYHHFAGKQDLFRVVFEQVEAEVTGVVGAAALGAGGVWEGIVAATRSFLDACADPAVSRITLIEAPAVLGFDAWREVMDRYGLGLTQTAIEAAMSEGLMAPGPAGPVAQVVLGALNAAGLAIARAEDHDAAREQMESAVMRLIEGLRQAPS